MISTTLFGAPPAIQDIIPELVCVLSMVGARCWIAGGALRDAVAEYPDRKDVDVFFPCREAFDAGLANVKAGGGVVVHDSPAVVSLTTIYGTVDLVRARFAPSPIETIDLFDFVACCAAITSDDYVRHERFEVDAYARVLRIHRITQADSPKRSMRLVNRGYRIHPIELERLKAECSALPASNAYQVAATDSSEAA